MPPRRNKEKLQQLTEFEWERMIGLREGEFSYHGIGARVQRNSSIVMQLPPGSWCTATSVLMLASSIRRRLLHRGLCVRVPLYRISLTANHRRLRLQWDHEHRAW
ncbi:transposable element Tc1 transposase [Trichonephila clavipes]|nr:transposable element Tc1 transposase [Trichonephila clavipes]